MKKVDIHDNVYLFKIIYEIIISKYMQNNLIVFICHNIEESKLKYILFWNEAYGSTKYGFCCGKQPFSVCPVKDCYITDDRKILKDIAQFDAIQFHQRSMDAEDLPSKRAPSQRYIMWYMESAAYPLGFDR